MPLPFSDSINHDFALNRRRQIAVRIDEVFGDHPDVTTVFVFGSVAYGHPDGSSDIDVGVVCHPDVLTRLQRRGLLWQVSPEWKFDYFAESVPTQAIWDTYDKGLVDGITVEVHYMTVSKVSRVLDQVINKGAITTAVVPFRPYRLGSLLERAWVLRDKQGIFEQWRSQAAIYPPQLKQNILSHNIPILKDAADELKISAERRLGPGVFLFFLFHGQHALDSILFALNDMYDPASRWD